MNLILDLRKVPDVTEYTIPGRGGQVRIRTRRDG